MSTKSFELAPPREGAVTGLRFLAWPLHRHGAMLLAASAVVMAVFQVRSEPSSLVAHGLAWLNILLSVVVGYAALACVPRAFRVAILALALLNVGIAGWSMAQGAWPVWNGLVVGSWLLVLALELIIPLEASGPFTFRIYRIHVQRRRELLALRLYLRVVGLVVALLALFMLDAKFHFLARP